MVDWVGGWWSRKAKSCRLATSDTSDHQIFHAALVVLCWEFFARYILSLNHFKWLWLLELLFLWKKIDTSFFIVCPLVDSIENNIITLSKCVVDTQHFEMLWNHLIINMRTDEKTGIKKFVNFQKAELSWN